MCCRTFIERSTSKNEPIPQIEFNATPMPSRHTLRAITALLLAAGVPAFAATAPASAVSPANPSAKPGTPVSTTASAPLTTYLDTAPVDAVIVATPVAGKADAQRGGEAIQLSAGACKYSGRVHSVTAASTPAPTGFLDKLMAIGRGGPEQHWEGFILLTACEVPHAGVNTRLAAFSFESSSVSAGEHVRLLPMKVPVVKAHHTPPGSVVVPGAIKLPSGYSPLPPAQAQAEETVRSAAQAASAAAVFEAAKARAALMASGTKVVKTPQVIPGVRPAAPAIPASDMAALQGVTGASGVVLPVMARPAAAPQAPAPAGTVVNAAGVSQKASLAMFASAAAARAAQAASAAPATPPATTP